MKKWEIYIDLNLQDSNCMMISPEYTHVKDEDGFSTHNRKERNPDNLVKLENIISTCMQRRQQEELLDTLNKKIPILYIDCLQKWEDDIMLFILKEYIKISKAEDKNIALGEAIWDNSVATESRQERNKTIREDNPTTEEILSRYQQLLKNLLQKNDNPEYKTSIEDAEAHITFDGLGGLMKQEDQKYLYLYLDNIGILTWDEQRRINVFLYTRWRIKNDRRIRIKINNGKWLRKTRTTSTWHRTQGTHDYSDINIREHELE